MLSQGTIRALAALPLLVACDDAALTSPGSFPVSFTVINHLAAPVTIAVDGEPILGLKPGTGSALTVPSTAQWLTWSSAKPMDPAGRPVPDDLGDVQVAIGGINRVLEISNVVGDQPYITAEFFNVTSRAAYIGVHDGTSVACAARLPAASNVAGYTRIGYYRLTAVMELRAYRDTACTGSFVTWSAERLRSYMARSGLIALTIDTPP